MTQRHTQFQSYKEELDHLFTEKVGVFNVTKLFYALYRTFGRRLVPLSEFAESGLLIDEDEVLYQHRKGTLRQHHLFVLEKRKDHPVVSLEAMVFYLLSEIIRELPDKE